MIRGINPLVISAITYRKAVRRGLHPAKSRYLKKKNPIRGFLGFYQMDIFDKFWHAEVRICGADGNVLKYIPCASNDTAKQLCKELNSQLEDYVQAIRSKKAVDIS